MSIRAIDAHKRNLLGYGIVTPFRRAAGSDFVTAEGETLVRGCIDQILGTKPGELPWRPTFGANIEQYRHRNMSDANLDGFQNEVARAILAFEPRVGGLAVGATRGITNDDNTTMYARLRYGLTPEASEDGTVLVGPITQEVQV